MRYHLIILWCTVCLVVNMTLGSDIQRRTQGHGPFSYDCWNSILEYLPIESSYFYYGVYNRDITEQCASRIVLEFIAFCRGLSSCKNKKLVYKKMEYMSHFYKTVTPQTGALLIKYFKEHSVELMRYLSIAPVCAQQCMLLNNQTQCAVLYMFFLCKPFIQRSYPRAFWLLLPDEVRSADIRDRLIDSTETLCCTPFGQTRCHCCCPVLCLQETLLTSCLACILYPFFWCS